MGLFDKMFGGGASAAQGQPDAQKRFNDLKTKYQSVLNTIEQQDVRLANLHVQDNKLFIKGAAPSEDAKNKVWEQVKLVDPNYASDLTCDIGVEAGKAMGAAAEGGAGAGGQTYTVKSGDTLSKISKQFYGDANEYMRIFYANRDKLRDPDMIQVGQELTVPPGDKA
ncbi:MAG TPA: LysM peptidoglycan-binding domain-containing protein [Pyrinomonadaceae bacterium]|jgi:nucleoid-associated protein YgaU|nr:LysM peptidoglycan-binding domain-containing protein [Pyrinomonadaceae bacterium]